MQLAGSSTDWLSVLSGGLVGLTLIQTALLVSASSRPLIRSEPLLNSSVCLVPSPRNSEVLNKPVASHQFLFCNTVF